MKCLDEYGRFDKTLWNPQYYDTIEGINSALEENGIFEKSIKCVHVIGLCLENNEIDYPWELGLHDYNIPRKERIERKKSWLEKNKKKCSVLTCEPIVIVFTDDSTLELMPHNVAHNVDGMLLSFNQISPEVIDGTNISDMDSETLFQHVAGLKISQIIRFKECFNRQDLKEDVNINTNVWTCFLSNEDGGVFVNYNGGANFVFGITTNHKESQRCFVSYVNATFYNSTITNKQKQVKITEGNDGSDTLIIFPTKRIEVSNGDTNEMIGHIVWSSNKLISIDLDNAKELLFYFLCKYFDSNYPYNEIPRACKWGDEPPFEFDEYTSNLYTYEAIYKMLGDIENCCKLLESDYDNPKVEDLKGWFGSWAFRTDDDVMCATQEEEKAMIKNNIHIAIDFYRSFIRRMKIMLRNAPEYDLVCFEGP